MLIGEYEHTLDAKGRLSMPAKLRRDMGEAFIVTKGLDGCLFAFSQEEWKNFETKLKALPLSDKNARNFVRFFLAGATECELDKQGRFLIPNNLRTAAKLEKEAIIIGVGTRLEIWNKEIWESKDEEISADLNSEETFDDVLVKAGESVNVKVEVTIDAYGTGENLTGYVLTLK
jgi:MraZ protein